ncbi:MAG TPA: SurA N-terminal domain-containing protein [Pyrinomonadaceae bacterium]|nr:SurA N-terminal domain-containing protein [Pyrinomonadaceae bacterium]
MLKQLRNLKHTRNFVIIGFIVFMAASLVFFYKPGGSGSSVEPTRNMDVVARVNGDEITVADLAQLKENYRQMFGDQMLAQPGSNQRFLDGLIRDRVVSQEAVRLSLAASKEELQNRLLKQFTDPAGKFMFTDSSGKVDLKKYQDAVNNRYGGIERFEKSVRDSIEQEKLRAFVTASVTVSPEEVQDEYKHKFTEFDLSYVAVNIDKLAEKMQVSDQDLRAYFDQHKDSYKINEPQKKIRYVFINQDKAGEKLQIPDKDLQQEYENLDAEHKQAGVKVQQILLKVARKDLDSQVEQKTNDLITKLRANGQVTEQSFAEIAKGNSEDPATAKNGGALGRLIKRNPNKADGLYDRVLDMQPGDVTDVPIRYAGNFYILRRGDSVPKTFEEAKPELLVSLRNRRGYSVASALAQRAVDSLKKSHDPQKVAQELAAEANMKPADMVRETPYIKAGDDVPNIGANQQFEQAIAALNNPNDVGERTGIKNGFAIPMFVDKKDPRVPEFDEVKDRIGKDYKQAKAKEQLDQKARDLAASVNSEADLKAAAEKAGFEVKTEEAYKEGRAIEKLGSSPMLDQIVYPMKEGEVTKTPIKIGENWVIVGVTKRREANLADFAKQREQLTETALTSRRTQVYEDYVSAAIARMKNEGKIKINKAIFDQIEQDEPQITMPPRRGFPVPSN